MLEPRQGPERSIRHPTGDPIAGISAFLIGLVAVGLFVAGVLAVYDYALPPALGPVILVLAALFGLVLLLTFARVTVRSLRRLGR